MSRTKQTNMSIFTVGFPSCDRNYGKTTSQSGSLSDLRRPCMRSVPCPSQDRHPLTPRPGLKKIFEGRLARRRVFLDQQLDGSKVSLLDQSVS